jgi:glycosyltransferase involved in cell wall biosynthesis
MRPLRVGLNMLFLIPEWVGGTERYATALLEALVRAAPEDEYHVFLSAEAAALALPAHPSVRRVVCRTSARRRPARYVWEQLVLPAQLARRRIDLVHSLGYVGPLVSPCPRVVTVCDANYVVLRDFTSAVKRHVVPFFVRQSARRADHVLTLSHHAAAEIVADTGIDPGRITVTHLGGRESEAPRAEVAWPTLAERYGLTKPYLLAFGGLNPHKNMPGLLEAFSRLGGAVPHRLVLAGRVANLPALEKKYLEGLGDRVRLAGYVPDSDLGPLLRNAELFVFPTLYEGFGLPVLEAQELGVPVACSRVGSLPEVAGDSVFFFDPLRPDDMAAAITRCLADAALRDELVLKGHANVRRFSWAEAAAITRGVYRKVLGLPPPGAPGARDAPSPAGPPRV